MNITNICSVIYMPFYQSNLEHEIAEAIFFFSIRKPTLFIPFSYTQFHNISFFNDFTCLLGDNWFQLPFSARHIDVGENRYSPTKVRRKKNFVRKRTFLDAWECKTLFTQRQPFFKRQTFDKKILVWRLMKLNESFLLIGWLATFIWCNSLGRDRKKEKNNRRGLAIVLGVGLP